MHITFLLGSPKPARYSVTARYIQLLEQAFPQHRFSLHAVGNRVGILEKDAQQWSALLDEVANSDLIVWSFPVYYLWVPGQLKRCIELIRERDGQQPFAGKYATALTTSIHFFDHTAHTYIRGISEDLEMCFAEGYSAGMNDMLQGKERKRLLTWFGQVLEQAGEKQSLQRVSLPLPGAQPRFSPPAEIQTHAAGTARILIISDARPQDHNLQTMQVVFRTACSGPVETVNLNQIKIAGGCQGCLHCAWDSQCKLGDDVRSVLEKIEQADAVVYALRIVDRGFSSRMKMFRDRNFMFSHTPRHQGKQVAFLVSGPLSLLPNLRQIVEGLFAYDNGHLLGMVSDEQEDSAALSATISGLAKNMESGVKHGLSRPATFLGQGGHKIFRDFIYVNPIFRQDYRFYRRHRYFDFPQRKRLLRLMSRVMRGLLRVLPPFRKQVYGDMRPFMVRPYDAVLKKVDNRSGKEGTHTLTQSAAVEG